MATQLKKGVRFKLDGKIYMVLKTLSGLKVEVEETQFGNIQIYRQSELIQKFSAGLLQFECIGKNSLIKNCDNFKNSFHREDICDSPHENRTIFRYEVIKPLLTTPQAELQARMKERVVEINSLVDNPQKIHDVLNGCIYYQKISYTTLYRWLKSYKESSSGSLSLYPSYTLCGGKGKPRLDPIVINYISESIDEFYSTHQQVTIKDLWFDIYSKIDDYNKYAIEKLKIPSYPSVARHVSSIPAFELIAKRVGKRSAENRYSQVGNGVQVSFPLERVEIDHTPVDMIVLDEDLKCLGRPYLILAIDKFSRQVLGFHVGISNGVGWAEVMYCILHIMTDKSYVKEVYPKIKNEWTAFGIPSTIVLDNGHEFKNKAMEDAARQLGFIIQYCPPKVPQWKGSIERFFGTSNTSFFHNLPGTTRSNPTKLGDDENPSKNATIRFSLFVELIHRWIIDVYSQDFHKGVGGKPADIWSKSIENHPITFPNNLSDLAILLGNVEYRQITRRGIALNSLPYNCDELNQLLHSFSKADINKKIDFKVKYNPHNLSEIYVYDHVVNCRWLRVPCIYNDYARNLSLWEHTRIKSLARANYISVDYSALAKSKAEIRKMVEEEVGFTRKEIARLKRTTSEQRVCDLKTQKVISTQNPYKSESSPEFVPEPNLDLGKEISSAGIVIPETYFDTQKNKCATNLINMNSVPSRRSNSKNPINPLTSHPTDPIIEDFTGFSVITNRGGKKND